MQRNIGERKQQNRDVGRKVRAGNTAAGELRDDQRQSVVTAAGSFLPHYQPNADPDEGAAQNRGGQRMGSKAGQDRRELLPQSEEAREAEG